MTNCRKKYRLFSYAISLLFVNFVLFAPFFHHHHADDAVDRVEKTVTHSHLLNHNSDTHNSEDTKHSSFDETNHHHFIQLNSSFNINPSRGLQLNHIQNFYTNQSYYQEISEKETRRKTTANPESQLQWEKYVHCATNVSPPLA
jgi:hypothetical protein